MREPQCEGEGNGGEWKKNIQIIPQYPHSITLVGTDIPERAAKLKRGFRGKNHVKEGEGVFNLTDITLTDQELYVLDQGLKFAPTKNVDKFKTFVDFPKFGRKLNIKKTFLLLRKSPLQCYQLKSVHTVVYIINLHLTPKNIHTPVYRCI